MSEFEDKSRQLSPDVYQRFKQALEQGRWPDGRPLDSSQKAIVMEAIIFYEAEHLTEQQRTGFIADQCRSDTKEDTSVIRVVDKQRGDEAKLPERNDSDASGQNPDKPTHH